MKAKKEKSVVRYFSAFVSNVIAGAICLGLSGTALAQEKPKGAAGPVANAKLFADGIEPNAKLVLEIDPKEFDRSENIDHPYWPLKPGMQWIYEGTNFEDGKKVPHQIVFTVTDLTKVIGGVRTRVIFDADYSDGNLVEKELTFFAQDKVGNVWHLGQYREVWEEGDFLGGQLWHVGSPEGSKAGIMMPAPADIKMGAPSFSEGYSPWPINWTDRGRVYKTGQKNKVPAGSYDDVVIFDEYSAKSKTDAYQLKYYARGVGNIRIGWRGKNATEREELVLVKVHQLGPKEMAEIRAKALDLEQRAMQYGKLAPAE